MNIPDNFSKSLETVFWVKNTQNSDPGSRGLWDNAVFEKKCVDIQIFLTRPVHKTESEFVDEIQTKVLKVFLRVIHSHLYSFAWDF